MDTKMKKTESITPIDDFISFIKSLYIKFEYAFNKLNFKKI